MTFLRGIRDGLRCDTVALDFEALAGDAALVAIAGGNGRGDVSTRGVCHPVDGPFQMENTRRPCEGDEELTVRELALQVMP